MPQQQIETTKRDLTDKYVAVASDLPELTRFAGLVGQVKTVNMSGRALVEWLGYHENIGWYDVDVAHLKIVEKPPEEVKPKATAKKPAAKPKPSGKGLSPLELLRQQAAKQSTKNTSDESNPLETKQKPKGPSPLELLRQQGGMKKTDDSN